MEEGCDGAATKEKYDWLVGALEGWMNQNSKNLFKTKIKFQDQFIRWSEKIMKNYRITQVIMLIVLQKVPTFKLFIIIRNLFYYDESRVCMIVSIVEYSICVKDLRKKSNQIFSIDCSILSLKLLQFFSLSLWNLHCNDMNFINY